MPKLDNKKLFIEKLKEDNQGKWSFFQDDMKEIYVFFENKGRWEIKNIHSEDFIFCITSLYFSIIKEITTKDAIKNIIDFLPHCFLDGQDLEKKTLNTRVAMLNDKIYYDFCKAAYHSSPFS